jgi:hypothetical protein
MSTNRQPCRLRNDDSPISLRLSTDKSPKFKSKKNRRQAYLKHNLFLQVNVVVRVFAYPRFYFSIMKGINILSAVTVKAAAQAH